MHLATMIFLPGAAMLPLLLPSDDSDCTGAPDPAGRPFGPATLVFHELGGPTHSGGPNGITYYPRMRGSFESNVGSDDAGTWSTIVARAYVDSDFFPTDGSRSQFSALEDPGEIVLHDYGYDPNQVMPDTMLTLPEYHSILTLGVSYPTGERFQPLLWNSGADSERTWTWDYSEWNNNSTSDWWELQRGDNPNSPDLELLSVDYMFRRAVLQQLGELEGSVFLGDSALLQSAVSSNLRLRVQVITLADKCVCAASTGSSLGGITGWSSAAPGSSNVLTFTFGNAPIGKPDRLFPAGTIVGHNAGDLIQGEVVGLLGDSNQVLLRVNGSSFVTTSLTQGFDLRHGQWQLPAPLPPNSIVKVVGYLGSAGSTMYPPGQQDIYFVGW